jgi:formate-dependent nitrite reductase membrane component NrfD
MTTDLALVLGIVIAGFSIPSILSAFSDRRAPRASAITTLIAGALILYAIQTKPGGYALEDVPNAFIRVVAEYIP